LAALLLALGTVLQQKGALSTAAGADDPRFLRQILHRPVWLAGTILPSAGWVVQAMALDRDSLVVVQSLTALSGTGHAGGASIGLVAAVGITLLAGSEEPVVIDDPPYTSLAR
jgi:hypothetical protein